LISKSKVFPVCLKVSMANVMECYGMLWNVMECHAMNEWMNKRTNERTNVISTLRSLRKSMQVLRNFRMTNLIQNAKQFIKCEWIHGGQMWWFIIIACRASRRTEELSLELTLSDLIECFVMNILKVA
jgi:hypothetical protein